MRAARRAGQRNAAAHLHAVLALAASAEGDASAVARHAAAALDTARRHGLAQTATLARWAVARDELARGHAVEAAARLGPLVGAGTAAVRLGADGTGGAAGHFAVRVLAMPCFVEAAALAGRAEAAGRSWSSSPWASLGADAQAPAQLARCRALLAPSDAGPWYEERCAGTRWLGVLSSGADAAAVREVAAAAPAPREAGTRLREALVEFEECGARSWAEQADSELRAAGSTRGGCGAAPQRF
ncbi:hypothetical protein [Streptomyces sp. C8S0]|uniref:hypothetical protein n=1 Tax=Streptomyces sp. C8S0 TaxID=2585716 RepID=UPI001D0467A3|nr:hypothetical protein [Streptomyces sp. C8S0]